VIWTRDETQPEGKLQPVRDPQSQKTFLSDIVLRGFKQKVGEQGPVWGGGPAESSIAGKPQILQEGGPLSLLFLKKKQNSWHRGPAKCGMMFRIHQKREKARYINQDMHGPYGGGEGRPASTLGNFSERAGRREGGPGRWGEKKSRELYRGGGFGVSTLWLGGKGIVGADANTAGGKKQSEEWEKKKKGHCVGGIVKGETTQPCTKPLKKRSGNRKEEKARGKQPVSKGRTKESWQ